MVKIKYAFSAIIWQHSGLGGWYFVSLPSGMSAEIRKELKWQEEGWGRLKTRAQIGESAWDTAIWFDSKSNTYLLPLKSIIRKKELLDINQQVDVNIWL